MIADWIGAKQLPPANEWTLEKIRAAFDSVPAAERKAAAARYPDDPRDSATPADMARLLVRIHKRDLHKPDSAALLVDILERCQTGDARLKGILPEGTVVAHKTGTVGSTTNDVGILTLPGEAGHVAIAVFVKASEEPMARRERAIAEIARAAHDYFLFQ
jgi:beta-lactamase class A